MVKKHKVNTSRKETMNNDLLFWIWGSKQITATVRSPFDDIELAVKGVSKASIDNLAVRLGISKKKMAEDIFSLSVKTMERKAPSEKLDKRTSSHAIEIAHLMHHAYQVFEDEEKVKHWMNAENRALKARKPVELLETLS